MAIALATDECRAETLFTRSIDEDFDRLADAICDRIDRVASERLATYAELFEEPVARSADLQRILSQAIDAALPAALSPRLLAPFARKANGRVPCSSSELRERLESDALRGVHEDLALTAVYGFKHGVTDRDVARLPIESVGFVFRISPDLRHAEVARVHFNLKDAASSTYLLPASNGTPSLLGDSQVVKVRGGDGVEKTGVKETIVIKAIEEFFKCLRDVVKAIMDKVSKGDLEGAWDDVTDAIKHFEEEIKDVDDDIKDLKKDLDKETDPDDKKKLKDKIDEKRAKKQALEDGKKAAEDAKKKIKEAMDAKAKAGVK
jgi:hypothetical protein